VVVSGWFEWDLVSPPPGSVPILQTREWSIAARSLISDER